VEGTNFTEVDRCTNPRTHKIQPLEYFAGRFFTVMYACHEKDDSTSSMENYLCRSAIEPLGTSLPWNGQWANLHNSIVLQLTYLRDPFQDSKTPSVNNNNNNTSGNEIGITTNWVLRGRIPESFNIQNTEITYVTRTDLWKCRQEVVCLLLTGTRSEVLIQNPRGDVGIRPRICMLAKDSRKW